MAKEDKHPPVKESKTAKDEKQSSVSATELAQALIEALQKNTVNRGAPRVVIPGSPVKDAILEYKAISDDLETLELLR